MTDQAAAPPPAAGPDDGAEPRRQCAACVIIKVAAFAVFTAYVAADFATGGAITGWLLAWLPRLTGRPAGGGAEE
jgi:hypothetical protein